MEIDNHGNQGKEDDQEEGSQEKGRQEEIAFFWSI